MGTAEDSKTKFDASTEAHKSNPLPRIGRMIVCVLTMGMAFPNAFSESVDVADYEKRSNADGK
jgi:hypothetical protein